MSRIPSKIARAVFALLAVASASTINADVLLHDNGPFVTHPGAGYGGSDASAVENVTLGMGSPGIGNQPHPNEIPTADRGNRVADDFTINSGEWWNITEFVTFGYQNLSGTTSTITSMNYRIWDGEPGAGGTIIYDFYDSNMLTSSVFSNVYRVGETNLVSTSRPIMRNTASAGFSLGPGTYWFDWRNEGSIGPPAGPYVPPITIPGQTTTGNGLQISYGTAGPALDIKTKTPLGFPFLIYGTVVPEPTTMTLGLLGIAGGLMRRRRVH